MAKEKQKDLVNQPVEEKLRALYRLQLIDSAIDKIKTIRGELPLEVEDLEDEIAGLDTRVEKIQGEITELENNISEKKGAITDSLASIKKYESQQANVRNNREFDSLAKEIEYQTLEIQLSEKRIKETQSQIENKQEVLAQAKGRQEERAKDLAAKKEQLDKIVKETEKEEKDLSKAADEAKTQIEERLITAYSRIRTKVPNGMAVVPIERGSSAGSFIKIPPQRQLDIAARKKIIADEHSGRILVDQDLANEETEKLQSTISVDIS